MPILTFGITIEGLYDMLMDLRAAGQDPFKILLHPMELREAKEDYIARNPDKAPDAEQGDSSTQMWILNGCIVDSHPEVSRKAAWVQTRGGNFIRIG